MDNPLDQVQQYSGETGNELWRPLDFLRSNTWLLRERQLNVLLRSETQKNDLSNQLGAPSNKKMKGQLHASPGITRVYFSDWLATKKPTYLWGAHEGKFPLWIGWNGFSRSLEHRDHKARYYNAQIVLGTV